jgi:hypothetical protein
VNDYHALRDYLKKQKLPEFVLSYIATRLPDGKGVRFKRMK